MISLEELHLLCYLYFGYIDRYFRKGKTIINYSAPKSQIAAPKISSTGKPAEVEFSVHIDGQKYVYKYDEWSGEIPHEGIEVGNKYLVLYPNDFSPNKCRMQFHYPIKDSADFKSYIAEFEKMRTEDESE